jgi:hypothetical protein
MKTTAYFTKYDRFKVPVMLCLLVLSPHASRAQVYFGGRVGLSRSSIVQRMDLDYRSGARLGGSVAVLADIPVYKRFSLRPEAAFSYGGGSYLSAMYNDDSYLLRNTLKSYGLSIPVNLAYNIPVNEMTVTVSAGPVVDVILSQELSNGRIRPGDEADISNAEQNGVRGWDAGANVGIALEYRGLFFAIQAQSGFVPMQKHRYGEARAYHNTMTFSLGYIIR